MKQRKLPDEPHDPRGQENKIYTMVKGRETFYRLHTVPITSCSEVKYVLKKVKPAKNENEDKHNQSNKHLISLMIIAYKAVSQAINSRVLPAQTQASLVPLCAIIGNTKLNLSKLFS